MHHHRHAWEDVIDDETREVYNNYARSAPLDGHMALLCIDNYNAVFGDRPEPIREALRRFPSSCGLGAWQAVEPTRRLMEKFRQTGILVVHTTRNIVSPARPGRSTTRRVSRGESNWSWEHFPELMPEENEIVIKKERASAFFGTDLNQLLSKSGIRTIVICGNTTSGCVRATAVDGYSYGFDVTIVEDCVFDRSPISHAVNLFDLNAKYASVRFLDEVMDHLSEMQN